MYGRTLTKGFDEGFTNLRKFLYKNYIPNRYTFKSIIPVDHAKYYQIPRQKWYIEQQQFKIYPAYYYLGLFIFGFYITDIIYSLHNNSKQSYRLYVMYPRPAKDVDDFMNDQRIKPWLDIAKDVWVKDYVEFRAFWEKVSKQINQKSDKQKNRIHDNNVVILKKQLQQVNKKYPLIHKKQQQSVF